MANILYGALSHGVESTLEYLSQHVLTCLIPAFFIAGAIAAFIKKDAILKYFGPEAKKTIAYPTAAVSGTVLAVCSCTILPLFAGIYRKGSGIGPATAFLYAGPAINILAIVYTAQILGYGLGVARAAAAVGMSLAIGTIMATAFKEHDQTTVRESRKQPSPQEAQRPLWVTLSFFIFMTAILLVGASKMEWATKISIIYLLTMGIAYLLIYRYEKEEITDWGHETWDLSKKIFPILILGTFFVGAIAFFLPAETFRPYLGGNSLSANLLGAVIGALLYMPTLLEVPIIGTTFGYSTGVMGPGPALSLLLAGPAVSVPSIAVLQRIMGGQKTMVYIALVVLFSTMAGFVYGNIIL